MHSHRYGKAMTNEPRNRCYVAGVGMTVFGRHPDRTLVDLGVEAAIDALADADVAPKNVDAAYCGSAMGALVQAETGIGQSIMMEIGIAGIPVVNVENACATGATALHQAWRDVSSGVHDVVLVIGVDKAVMPKGTVLAAGMEQFEAKLGDIFPGTFALIANRHMAIYGTTVEQLAEVSVKNHDNGVLNEKAQFNKQMTVDEVLNAPMIAEPLTLFSCCPNSDGAAAAIICSEDWIRTHGPRDPIRISASVLASGYYDPFRDLTYWESELQAVETAYRSAGISAFDLDLVEVHDAFTISEIVHCEALGLCPRGVGGRLLAGGETRLGGKIPVNPSGGLLARGHPPGATGLAQIYEIVQQLRGTCGERQIDGARIGLAQIMGGNKANDAQACAIHILERCSAQV